MLSDLLSKIEKLHEFIDDCVSGDSLSLIDKDIILQNIRDIYMDANKLSLDDLDRDFDDDFENENIILFDSSEPLKHIESEQSEDVEPEVEHVQEHVQFEEVNKEEIIEEDIVCEQSEQEDQEQVVYMSVDENDLDMCITDSERELIIRELCAMDENRYYEIIARLSLFTDLDDALIYISEEFPLEQNSESTILLADKMVERLA